MPYGAVCITDVYFSSGTPSDRDAGLLGWLRCTLNNSVRLDGLTLRVTTEGRLSVSFPSRRDRRGAEHYILRPIDDPTRREFERQIFEGLGLCSEQVQR